MDIQEILKHLSLNEKAMLCSGRDFWHTKGIERLGIPPIMVSDGPHGLRKMGDSEEIDMSQSAKATCFPPACTTACSWDRALLHEIGKAIAEEALQEGISVVLGPAMNIKRSPLCGRNFEYISEDPYLTGELATAIIQGMQSRGIGTSAKHFCANSQEKLRFVIDSIVDERALREIYLAGFERVIKHSHPWTVMHSYNRLNGCYTGEDRRLLTDILRDEWGFDGIVMSDWGAINDRVQALTAGCELEMPGSGGINDKKIIQAVEEGRLSESVLDRAVERMLSLISKSSENRKEGYTYDPEAHHLLARKAAAQSYVLLKNDHNILPLKTGSKLAIIGAFAKEPRYQGGGSSHINPLRIDNAWDAFNQTGHECSYEPGYKLESDRPDNLLIDRAAEAVKLADTAIVFAGLTDDYESEGFDRSHMRMPESHNRLIEAVSKANHNTIIVLSAGSPIEMPWISSVKAVLHTCLGGQASGSAIADILTGIINPSGKLAETYPLKYEDTPCYHYFPGGNRTVEYRESIFVGYRYYDTAQREVLFPFGYGLSYTQFTYSDLELSSKSIEAGEEVCVTVKVKNMGKTAGAEIVQLYIHSPSTLFHPEKELKGFEKVFMLPGEEKSVCFTLDRRSFTWYDPTCKEWAVSDGEYQILLGSSSRDIRQSSLIKIKSQNGEKDSALHDRAPIYYSLPNEGKLVIPKEQFEAIYGEALPPSERDKREPYTRNSTLDETRATLTGKLLALIIRNMMKSKADKNATESSKRMILNSMMEMPLRAFVSMSGGIFSQQLCEGLLLIMNGHFIKGMKMILKSA